MKQYVYILLLTTFVQAVANNETIYAAQLPRPVESVCTAMIRPAIEALEGKIVEREVLIGWVSLKKVNQPLLKTPIGDLLSTLVSKGFSATLSNQPKVVAQAQIYFEKALQSIQVQTALSLAESKNDAPEEALHHWEAFDNHIYTSITETMNSRWPAIALMKTPQETIEKNAQKMIYNPDYGVVYDVLPEEEVAFKAAQLALGFGLRMQFEKSPQTFAKRFAAFLAADPIEQPTVPSSSNECLKAQDSRSTESIPFASSFNFWKQQERNNQSTIEPASVAQSSNTQELTETVSGQESLCQSAKILNQAEAAALGDALWKAGIYSL